MKEWYTAIEISDLKFSNFPKTERAIFPKTERAIQIKAKSENWKYRNREGRGGGKEFHISNLPKSAIEELANRALSTRNAIVPVEKRQITNQDVTALRASQREVMTARHVVLDKIDEGRFYFGSREKSIQAFLASIKAGTMSPDLKNCLKIANHKSNGNRTISRATLYNWRWIG